MRLYCSDFQVSGLDFECCYSCHSEDDEGWCELLEQEPPRGRRRKRGSLCASVCCSFPRAVDRHRWAAAARARRKVRAKAERKEKK